MSTCLFNIYMDCVLKEVDGRIFGRGFRLVILLIESGR